MKYLKFVAPTYEIPQERKTLYTKTVGDGERLDIVAWPLNPYEGTTLQNDIDMAYESVILVETDLKETDLCAPVIWETLKGGHEPRDNPGGSAKGRYGRNY